MAEAELQGIISGDASGFVTASKTATRALGKFTKSGVAANAKLKKTFGGSTFGKLTKSLGQLGGLAKKAGGAIASGLGAALKVAKGLAVGLGAIGAALGGIGAAAVTNFAKFQQSFSQVRTLVDESKVNVAELSEGVRQLSVEFGVDVIEATQAAYQAISAGQDPARVLDFLEASFKGAAAGAATTAQAVDLFTTVLNSFGAAAGDVENVADILFATIKAGKTTAAELAASFGQVAPVAASAGVSLEETAAAVATLTASGLNTAEAMTALKATLVGIIQPSGPAAKALAGIGISAESLRDVGLSDAIARVREAVESGNGAITDFFPNVRALVGVATLAGEGFDKFNRSLVETSNATGAAAEAFGKTASDISFQFSTLRQTLTDTFRTIGEALTPVAEALIVTFSNFATSTRDEVTVLARVIETRMDQAAASILGFDRTVNSSGGAISIALKALNSVLKELADFLEAIAGPAGDVAQALTFIGTVAKNTVVAPLALLATALQVVLEVLSAYPKIVTATLGALARLAGLGGLADALDDANAKLNETTEEVGKLADGLRSELADGARDAVAEVFNFSERSKETSDSIRGLGADVRDAAAEVDKFGEEIADAVAQDKFEQALKDADAAIEELTPDLKDAAKGVKELGDAGAGAAPGLDAVTGAATKLDTSLKGIAAGSKEVARGLSDLGPIAERISKAIGGIALAQTDEQATERRGKALVAAFKKADDELTAAVDAAFQRRQAAIAPAETEVLTARREERDARTGGDEEDVVRAVERTREAEAALEAAVRAADEAFKDQRATITETFEAARDEIAKTEGGLAALRENQIANAKAAGEAEIKRIEDQANKARDIQRELLDAGSIGEPEFLSNLIDIADDVNTAITKVRENVDQELGFVADRFDRLSEEIREAEIDKAFEEAFGTAEESIGKLADKLTGEYAEAVAAAREQAKLFGVSQEELDERLQEIVDDADEAAESIDALGESTGELADGLEDVGKDAKAAAEEIKKVGDAAESAAAKISAASAQAKSFSRTGVGQRPGGETQRQANQRLGGFGFGIQSSRPATVESVFNNLSASQRNSVRQQARDAGVTNDQEFTRFVVENSPGLDAGGLSFDLGGPVRVDQLARLQAGERVLSRSQNAAFGALVAGFSGSRPSGATFNISPTFNIEGGNAEANREMARSLIPEITRATKLGVIGKGIL